jgi:hypothetical protein
VALEAMFLFGITTADGKYLKHLVFDPGGKKATLNFTFPCEKPTKNNWNSWFKFWRNFTITGDKLHVP